MRKILLLAFVSGFLAGCDYLGSYTFKISNELTADTVRLVFEKIGRTDDARVNDQSEIILPPGVEKTVRIINGEMGFKAHDCLQDHGERFELIIFNAYIDEEKIDAELWRREYWTYRKTSKWSAEYTMSITDAMVDPQ